MRPEDQSPHRVAGAELLAVLDRVRQAAGTVPPDGGVVREFSPDGSRCWIIYAEPDAGALPGLVRREAARAASEGYELEWKLYGHDAAPGLAGWLRDAGFQPGEREAVLVLPLTQRAVAAIGAPAWPVTRVDAGAGLGEVAAIARESGSSGAAAQSERQSLELALRHSPAAQSVFLAFAGGVAAASGRIHYSACGRAAELAGGRTRPAYRRRGLYTALVAARLREALGRGREYVFTDALPTSEPVLTKLGFRPLTWTQPFVYGP